ncbi:MAG: S-methyl-5-thioribose-1-phosphate isomerase [Eubacteriales bacterium]|nr:S-methyl-5-thioribose-1-phosphate isomerase [Eubacteriales bacterium]MDD3881332.1 S-methyl-5-thioribose-1-phosphate isomerase [Eubacteriales bacterium]MDD4513692.1 S-methyl-5-thioribose-1-phosphate isomerase [Eubacteriales bacterium]
MKECERLRTDTVALDESAKKLVIIDQTLLPSEVKLLYLDKIEDIWDAIYTLKVRGAPAIGVAAAIGLYLAADKSRADDYGAFYAEFRKSADYLASSRPTAVNLFWAIERMDAAARRFTGGTIDEIKQALLCEAKAILAEDIEVCAGIGEYGLTLIKDGDGILTHCNAGQLAAVRYGTALAPMHLGAERGMHFRVFTDETRPLLQGARLSAYELTAHGIDTTVICDNMAASVMKNGWVQAVFVGCDRVAANGDAANKIGTLGVAILAAHYNIPFYVCAPLSTIDMRIKDGSEIPIEQRKPEEVTEMWYKKRMAPSGAKVYNPAFDVTEHSLITAFVTERGILRPPFDESIRRVKNGSTAKP